MGGGIGRQELIDALRALALSIGHESAGPNRCVFNTAGCSCGRTAIMRAALGEATRILREIDDANADSRNKLS